MDKFLSLANKGIEAYSESNSQVHKTGGAELNSPDNVPRSGSGININHDEAVDTAQRHGSGESDLFSTALSFLGNNKDDHKKPLDEEQVTKAHHEAYNQGNFSNLSANSIGSAAALQVLKEFTGGDKKDASQTDLISLAMAEATKLFDKSGGASSGNKQDAVNGAAMTVVKLLVQSKFSGTTGGSNSGGLSGLLSLASKFA